MVTIPDSVTSIEAGVFESCSSLTNITFEGNAPEIIYGIPGSGDVFDFSEKANIFIYPGATGFGETFFNLPVVLKAKTAVHINGNYSNGKNVEIIEFFEINTF